MYAELGKEDPDYEGDEAPVVLMESEKVLLTIVAFENVTKAYECKVYGFWQMIRRINERSNLDFTMLNKILE